MEHKRIDTQRKKKNEDTLYIYEYTYVLLKRKCSFNTWSVSFSFFPFFMKTLWKIYYYYNTLFFADFLPLYFSLTLNDFFFATMFFSHCMSSHIYALSYLKKRERTEQWCFWLENFSFSRVFSCALMVFVCERCLASLMLLILLRAKSLVVVSSNITDTVYTTIYDYCYHYIFFCGSPECVCVQGEFMYML